MIGFDPLYLIILTPAMILAMIASFMVKARFNAGQKVMSASGIMGKEAARRILDSEGLYDVEIEEVKSYLGDHYDPIKKVLRLSPQVSESSSLASLGVAAHEAGHAIQDAKGYSLLKLRNAVVPVASFGSNASMFLMMFGFVLGSLGLIKLGIVAFSTIVFFQLVNLPVEFDASKRAREILRSSGMIYQNEEETVAGVLNAAAMTYVAATISSILTLVYYLIRLGLLSSRMSDD
ncbi:MAG: zinc metallopeptidase [Bdellovibrionota bacterium]